MSVGKRREEFINIPKQLVYTAPMDVRWSDMDAFGHVNNSVYLTYFEQARVLWWENAETIIRDMKQGPILANAFCDFLKPLLYPASINILVYTSAPGRSSYTLYYEIKDQKNEVLYAQGSTVVVWIDYISGKPIELPDNIRKHLPNNKGK